MSTMREKFGDAGFGDDNAGILSANRSMGWSPIPLDAPEWVKQRVADTRTAILAGRETRSVKKLASMVLTPKPEPLFDETINEAREICRKNGITHYLDGEVQDDAAAIARRRHLLNALMS
jgi:hypothetical protein